MRSSSAAGRSAPGPPGSCSDPGIGDVVLLERDTLGQGASARAAGMVRAQGGTEAAVRLGMFSRDFYLGQQDLLGIDSGFVEQGYFMPCFTDAEVEQAHARIAMQQSVGLDVRWVESDEVDAMNPAMAPGQTLGASYAAGDGYLEPPRNVLAYTAALFTAGVHVRERTAFTGLVVEGGRVTGVRTSAGDIATEPGGADRRAEPGRRGRGGGRPDPVRRRASPGRGHREPPGLRARAAADGLRRGVGHLLAAVRGRRDVGDEQPRGAARRGDRVRRRLLRADERADGDGCCRRLRRSGCARPGPRPSTSPPTTCRSSGRRWAPTACSRGPSWPRPVGTG